MSFVQLQGIHRSHVKSHPASGQAKQGVWSTSKVGWRVPKGGNALPTGRRKIGVQGALQNRRCPLNLGGLGQQPVLVPESA